MALFTTIEGSSSALTFQLLSSGAPIDLTGATVTLLLNDKNDRPVSFSGAIAVTVAASGKITFTPTTTDLSSTLSPYFARFKVVDSGGKISFYPSSYRDQWDVIAQ